MRKLLFLLSSLFSFIIISTAQDMDVKIRSPKMTDMIERIWNNLPTDCVKVPASVTVDGGDESCASLALKHFRYIITKCRVTDAFKEAIKFEFKLLKLIPAGKVVGTILDVADLSAKALSADSPEALEADLVKYGFGKIVGDQVVKKLKDLVKADGDAGDVLENLTKLFYKQIWDKVKEQIFPREQQMECHPESGGCKDNIFMTIQPYSGDDSKVVGKLIFSADGDCDCTLPCAAGQPGNLLDDWNLHGELPIMLTRVEVVEEGWLSWKTKVLQVTLEAGQPSYHVTANCNCPRGSSSGISYDNPNTIFVGIGLINEDAGDRFNTYGGNVAYTHIVSSMIGITGDAGVYFGSNYNVDYTKFHVLAGVSVIPGNQNGKIIFSPHLLAGIVNIRQKYMTVESSSSTSFSIALGTDVKAKINEKTGVGLRLDYNPTFAKGGASHNFRLGGGAFFRLAKK